MRTNARAYHVVRPAIALSIIVASACSEGKQPTADEPVSKVALQNPGGFDFVGERTYRELARQIPSLGGWYFDTTSGNLMVYVKDLREAATAKSLVGSRLAHELSETRRRHPHAVVVTRQAAYTWLELKHWRDLLRQVMPDTPGMVTMGIGENRNRVEIGLDYGYDSAAIRSLVGNLGIPQDAVLIEITGPLVPFNTVRDRFRPYLGGVQTQWINEFTFETHVCTLGFNALTWDNREVFLTASHCSMTPGSADGTFTFQPIVIIDSMEANLIGSEVEDFGVPCGHRTCTFADAALYTPEHTADWVLGRIARTACACYGPGCTPPQPCQIEIDNAKPFFTITATKETSYSNGQLILKVGEATGTTQGYVTDPCKTASYENLLVDCVGFATFVSGNGDSGGPVFLDWSNYADDTITLGGVVVAGFPGGKVAFSLWANVEQNYPGLRVF